MSVETSHARIVNTPGVCGGRPRIDGHRIRVQDVAVEHDLEGLTADEICRQHPGLTLAEVHAALAYDFDHIDEIRADLDRDRRAVEEFRRQHADPGG